MEGGAKQVCNIVGGFPGDMTDISLEALACILGFGPHAGS